MRLPRADEIAQATEYVYGLSVEHTGTRVLGRAYQAKCAYWTVLERYGFSVPEIARMVGADRATITHGLSHSVPHDQITWIEDHARRLVEASTYDPV